MKKIIEGIKYDTETAIYITTIERFDSSVCFHQKEHFYRKRNGEFFRHDQKRTTWGDIHDYQKIVPLEDIDAQLALEDHLSCEEYEEIFGVVCE